jgi:hypothetical protein
MGLYMSSDKGDQHKPHPRVYDKPPFKVHISFERIAPAAKNQVPKPSQTQSGE